MKGELEKEGFTKMSSRCTAKILRTYKDSKGRMRIRDELVVGKPNYVKGMTQATHNGESVKVEASHTFNTYSREIKEETTDGVAKMREIVEEQYDGIGNENPSSDGETYSRDSDEGSEPQSNGELTPLKVLKNLVDKIADRVEGISQTITTLWIVILAVGLIAVAGLIIAWLG